MATAKSKRAAKKWLDDNSKLLRAAKEAPRNDYERACNNASWKTAFGMNPEVSRLRTALHAILDQVDYTNNACHCTEMVGAVLSKEVIQFARDALKPIPNATTIQNH